MSLPRAVVKGRVYVITRRCSERRFFMRPDRETTNAFIYCLAIAAHRHGVTVFFAAAMSNHHHTGIIDKEGRLPEFLAYFHSLFAKHQNALRGRWGNFWAWGEQPSAVELVTPEDAIDKMVYAVTNPVKDHLVEKTHHWPGVDCLPAIEQRVPLVAAKPARFFRQDNDNLPDVVTLELVRPPGTEHFPKSAPKLSPVDDLKSLDHPGVPRPHADRRHRASHFRSSTPVRPFKEGRSAQAEDVFQEGSRCDDLHRAIAGDTDDFQR